MLVLVGEVPCKALTLIIPLWYWIPLATALSNEWTVVLEDVPGLHLNVLESTTVTVNHLPLAGSVDLGYAWVPPPAVHVNTNDWSTILILCPETNPWSATVIVNRPVVG